MRRPLRRVALAALAPLTAALAACGEPNAPRVPAEPDESPPPPEPPELVSIAPTRAVAGGESFNLGLDTRQVDGAPVMLWNGEERPVSHFADVPDKNIAVIQATVPEADIARPGTVEIAVRDATDLVSEPDTLEIVELEIPPGGATLAAGGEHTCAIAVGGEAFCWGENFVGELGTGTGNVSVPAPVTGGLAFTGIAAAGDNTCGVTTEGALYCWGANELGQLGDGTFDAASAPRPVAPSKRFGVADVGLRKRCALTTKGATYCWGTSNPNRGGGSLPARIPDQRPFTALTVGRTFACALDLDDAAWCWGVNGTGALGTGFGGSTALPRAVLGEHRFRSLAAGDGHTCGVTLDDVAWCWGRNRHGQLGDQTTTRTLEPVRVATDLRFRQVSVGRDHTCGIATDGTGWCWGLGSDGQLGVEEPGEVCGEDAQSALPCATTPRPIAGDHTFAALALSDGRGSHTCGITVDGDIYCWGANNDGQLGDGTIVGSATPVRVAGPQVRVVPQ